jgi:hypothetical protein
MNILEALLQAQGGQMANALGDQFGLSSGQTQAALGALLPALAGALNQNARQPGGLDALMGALAGGRHGRYIEDPRSLGDPATTTDGNGILGHLFGNREVSREVAARASTQTGIGADILKQMLPVVAAMVMGGLARQSPGGGMGGMGGLGQAPSAGVGARPGAGGGLLDMLTPMLDRNRDGSAIDDLLGMAASFLTKR